jgi:site-specific DNA-methyltransferase (adenine-specific)
MIEADTWLDAVVKAAPVKPYYRDSAVVIFNADCKEIVPTLPRADLLLTDPPYGIGNRMQGGTWGAKAKYADFRAWDVAPETELLTAIVDLATKAIVWGGNYFTLSPSRCWLVWDKQNAVPTMADCEFAWSNLDRPAKRMSLPVGVHTFGHPTQKPLALMTWCITLADDVQTILDVFAGSCTTGRAAKDLGRLCVCIEREERYCEIGAKRMQQEVLPIFTPTAAPDQEHGMRLL